MPFRIARVSKLPPVIFPQESWGGWEETREGWNYPALKKDLSGKGERDSRISAQVGYTYYGPDFSHIEYLLSDR
jgi:hypothetical protein